MNITVKLFASFRTGRIPLETREYPAGTTVADIVAEQRIPVTELGIIMVNSRHVVAFSREIVDEGRPCEIK